MLTDDDFFDPYATWLGIPSDRQPPTFYDLLGIDTDTDDIAAIRLAYKMRREFIESLRGKGHDASVNKILNQLAEAEVTLTDEGFRTEYDKKLRLFDQRRSERRRSRQRKREQAQAAQARQEVRTYKDPYNPFSGIAKDYFWIFLISAVGICGVAWFSSRFLWDNPPRELSSNEKLENLLNRNSQGSPKDPSSSNNGTENRGVGASESTQPPDITTTTPSDSSRRRGDGIDLLSRITLPSDEISPKWWREGTSLACESSDTQNAILRIPYDAPDEYTIEFKVRWHAPNKEGALLLGLANSQVGFGAHLKGNEKRSWLLSYDGDRITKAPVKFFQTGEPVTITCTVLSDSIRVEEDGRLKLEWKGDFSKLSRKRSWATSGLPNQRTMYICSWGAFEVSAIKAYPLLPIRTNLAGTRPLEELNTPGDERSPWISRDGKRIYWWLRPTLKTTQSEIWTAERPNRSMEFGNKRRIAIGEGFTLTADELEMIYLPGRAKNLSLHVARRQSVNQPFGPPELIDELEDYNFDSPSLSGDGLTLVAESRSTNGSPYLVKRKTRNSHWAPPTAIKVPAFKGKSFRWRSPFLSDDGRTLWGTVIEESDSATDAKLLRMRRANSTAEFTSIEEIGVSEAGESLAYPRLCSSTGELFFVRFPKPGDLWVAELPAMSHRSAESIEPTFLTSLGVLEKHSIYKWVSTKGNVILGGVNGRPHRMANLVYHGAHSSHGIYTHATGEAREGSVTFKLGRRFHELRTVAFIPVAFHDQGDPGSPLVFKVVGDGEVLWQSRPLSSRGNEQDCRVSVEGIDQLSLRVVATGSTAWALGAWHDPLVKQQVRTEENGSPQEVAAQEAGGVGNTDARVLETLTQDWDLSETDYVRLEGNSFELGMGRGKSGFGLAAAGWRVTNASKVRMQATPSGQFGPKDENSFVGLVIDYHFGDRFVKRVALTPWRLQQKRTVGTPNWGKGTPPDEVKRVIEANAYTVRLADYAPKNWDGEAWVTLLLQNTGPGTALKGRIEFVGQSSEASVRRH